MDYQEPSFGDYIDIADIFNDGKEKMFYMNMFWGLTIVTWQKQIGERVRRCEKKATTLTNCG